MRVNPCFCLTDVTHSKTVVRNPHKLLGISEPRENDATCRAHVLASSYYQWLGLEPWVLISTFNVYWISHSQEIRNGYVEVFNKDSLLNFMSCVQPSQWKAQFNGGKLLSKRTNMKPCSHKVSFQVMCHMLGTALQCPHQEFPTTLAHNPLTTCCQKQADSGADSSASLLARTCDLNMIKDHIMRNCWIIPLSAWQPTALIALFFGRQQRPPLKQKHDMN